VQARRSPGNRTSVGNRWSNSKSSVLKEGLSPQTNTAPGSSLPGSLRLVAFRVIPERTSTAGLVDDVGDAPQRDADQEHGTGNLVLDHL
jgi:hypothetical protein